MSIDEITSLVVRPWDVNGVPSIGIEFNGRVLTVPCNPRDGTPEENLALARAILADVIRYALDDFTTRELPKIIDAWMQKEREACARLADARSKVAYERSQLVFSQGDVNEAVWMALDGLAAAIRARSNP